MYAGVDGCRQGWVALVLPQERLLEGCTEFADLLRQLRDMGVTTVGVDMPIDAPETGERECDLAVRGFLGARRASLFITPTRAALACATQAEATRLNRELGGKGVSAQAFALRHKIAEVAAAPASVDLVEVHPETTFAVLGPARYRKKTWAGMRERVRILEAQGLQPLAWESTGWAAADDTLDAAAAALSARRVAAGQARRFPAAGTGPLIWA